MSKLRHITSSTVSSVERPDLRKLYATIEHKVMHAFPDGGFTTDDFAKENSLNLHEAVSAVSKLVREGKVIRKGEFKINGARKRIFVLA